MEKMISQFIEQVEILMQIQRIKITRSECSSQKYIWLCNKKVPSEILSFKNEYKIRQALLKINGEEQIEVLRKLTKWLRENPDVDVATVPETTLNLIERASFESLLRETNLRRTNSFRRSLRRFSRRISLIGNPIRSVSFKEQPVVYRFSN
ncbi:unnamed protein product [Phyllotreta striolata]|uniref:Uncharacterized protein n=1 Tax=Phyllotreta striolata TaxID=444603 RepID=A0A9N9XQ75_PHYSR|nr:unnamed protein product [Phyllotreta striolata]